MDFTYETVEVSNNPVSINNRWNFNDVTFSQAEFIWNLGTQVGEAAETEQVSGLLDSRINSFSIFQSTSSYDRTIMLTNGRLYFFNEPIMSSYQRVIKDTNYANYGSEGFSLNSDSFIYNWEICIKFFLDDILSLIIHKDSFRVYHLVPIR